MVERCRLTDFFAGIHSPASFFIASAPVIYLCPWSLILPIFTHQLATRELVGRGIFVFGSPLEAPTNGDGKRRGYTMRGGPELIMSSAYTHLFLVCTDLRLLPRKSTHQPRYTTGLESLHAQITPPNWQYTMVPDYLLPRVVLLVLGRLVSGGGGGRATSTQSSELGGGSPTPGTFGEGKSLCGDTGVGSAPSSSDLLSDSLSDTEAIERARSLETKSIFSNSRRAPRKQTYSNSDERWFAHCQQSPLKVLRRAEKSWWN